MLGGGEVPEVGADVLIRRAALNQEFVLGVEEQDVNRTMKEPLGVNLVAGGLPGQLVAGVKDLKDFGRCVRWGRFSLLSPSVALKGVTSSVTFGVPSCFMLATTLKLMFLESHNPVTFLQLQFNLSANLYYSSCFT